MVVDTQVRLVTGDGEFVDARNLTEPGRPTVTGSADEGRTVTGPVDAGGPDDQMAAPGDPTAGAGLEQLIGLLAVTDADRRAGDPGEIRSVIDAVEAADRLTSTAAAIRWAAVCALSNELSTDRYPQVDDLDTCVDEVAARLHLSIGSARYLHETALTVRLFPRVWVAVAAGMIDPTKGRIIAATAAEFGEHLPSEHDSDRGSEQADLLAGGAATASSTEASGAAPLADAGAEADADTFPAVAAQERVLRVGGLVFTGTVAQMTEQLIAAAIGYARQRTARQLQAWLDRLLARLDPEHQRQRRRRALKERGIWPCNRSDGMTEITAVVPHEDAAAVLGLLDAAALEPVDDFDDRSRDARRADALVDLVTGRVQLPESAIRSGDESQGGDSPAGNAGATSGEAGSGEPPRSADPGADEVNAGSHGRVGSSADPSHHGGSESSGDAVAEARSESGSTADRAGSEPWDSDPPGPPPQPPDCGIGEPGCRCATRLRDGGWYDPYDGYHQAASSWDPKRRYAAALHEAWQAGYTAARNQLLDPWQRVAEANSNRPPIRLIPSRTSCSRVDTVINVVISIESLAGLSDAPGDITGYGSIPVEVARRLAGADSRWRHVLTELGTGAVLDVGTTSYRIPANIYRQVQLRDGHCRFPGCSVPADRCDQDHLIRFPWGPTSVDNLHCVCRHHHRVKHEADWEVEALGHGVELWRSATGTITITNPRTFDPKYA